MQHSAGKLGKRKSNNDFFLLFESRFKNILLNSRLHRTVATLIAKAEGMPFRTRVTARTTKSDTNMRRTSKFGAISKAQKAQSF